MKAIQVTCPNCGARLRADETSSLVTCEYCNTASAIQRRTRILERVMPPQQQAQRYAVQRHTRGWIIGILLGVALPMIIIGVVVASAVNKANRVAKLARIQIDVATTPFGKNNVDIRIGGKAGSKGPSWQGTDSVLVVDVDGDGTPELVGRGREVQAGDIVRVVAFDLMTGKQKWQTEPIGTYSVSGTARDRRRPGAVRVRKGRGPGLRAPRWNATLEDEARRARAVVLRRR